MGSNSAFKGLNKKMYCYVVLWHLVSDSSECAAVLMLSFDMATVHCVAIYTCIGMTLCNCFHENVHSLVAKFCEPYDMIQ